MPSCVSLCLISDNFLFTRKLARIILFRFPRLFVFLQLNAIFNRISQTLRAVTIAGRNLPESLNEFLGSNKEIC